MKKFFLPSFFILTLSFSLSTHADFSDVPKNSEYHQSITALQELGIVQGYENGQFDQTRLVSRGEFLKMVLLADKKGSVTFPGLDNLKIDLSCFPDVEEADWFAPYICWAKEEGVIEGYPDGNFHPHQTVNVSEAVKILAGGKDADVEGPWANGYFQQIMPYTLPTSIESADQLLTRAITAEMIWRYNIADENLLQSKSSKILAWDGEKFLDIDYIGKVLHFPFGYYYGRHENKIYGLQDVYSDFIAKELIGADAETFKIFYDKSQKEPYYPHAIAGDKNSLYTFNEPVPGSAGGKYELLDYNFSNETNGVWFSRDDKNIYPITCYEGCKLHEAYPEVDPDSFVALDDSFSKDKSHVYFIHGGFKAENKPIILEADSNSFEVLGHGYAKDDQHAFYLENILKFINVNDFSVFNRHYFASGDNVYFMDYEAKPTLVEEAILNSFEVFSKEDSAYYSDQRVIFAKDKNHVYYKGKILDGIDRETFHYETSSSGSSEWMDKNGSYTLGELNVMTQ